MNFINIDSCFMLPTQATDAIIMDVKPLLVIGALIMLYFIYKKHNKSSDDLYKNKVNNLNNNVRIEKDFNNSKETLFTLTRSKKINNESNISTLITDENIEDIQIVREKEKIMILNEFD